MQMISSVLENLFGGGGYRNTVFADIFLGHTLTLVSCTHTFSHTDS